MATTRRLAALVRFPVYVLALLALAVNAFAQGASGLAPAPAESELVRVLSQGGPAAVLVVVLWSYRRDLATLLKEERDRTATLVALIERSTAALQRVADAVERCPTNQGGE